MVVDIKHHCSGEIIEWKWSSDSKLLPAPFWTSCFLIDGLLIDSGAPGSVDDLRKFILSLDDDHKVKKCVITHSHEDHCGGAAMLQSEFNIPIYASKKALPLLKKKKNYPDYRRITWGFPYHPFDAKAIESSISTCKNKYRFDIIEIPGHAIEEIALLERTQEWAIIADGIMPKYTMIFGKTTDIPEDIFQIYESLRKIEEITEDMDNLVIFTAGRGIFKNRSMIKEKIEEIEDLHEKAFKFQKEAQNKGLDGKRFLKYITRKIFGKENFIGKLTRGGLSNQNLIMSLLEWPLEKK